jgi:hypothetical protein
MSDFMIRLCCIALTLPLISTPPLSCKGQGIEASPTARAERVILFIIDGLAKDAPERIPMPELQKLAEQGCTYSAMHLPLPGHPRDDPRYPWSCSMPNPMLMAGTPFIGAKGIRRSMIQHQFEPEETAFVVNAYSYKDVSNGFGVYLSHPHREDDIVITDTKRLLTESRPIFMRVHLQRAGIEGQKCSKDKYADKPWHHNIWHPNSPYRKACLRADQLLGDFVAWLKERDLWQGTVLLVCGDHGQADEGWHEPYSASSSVTTLVIAGTGVVPGRRFEYCEIFDISPTVAHIAGRAAPALAIGRVLHEAFDPDLQPPQVPQNVSLFNEILRAAQNRSPDQLSVLKQKGFLTIDEISQWHTTKAGTDFPRFLRLQQRLVAAL